ncbi:bifunctional phosphoribosylaminoimidazolecarboxamide formyltransferase/IMP cyclohydrolase [Priestia endophytica]|uniref:bifunctional phosphoribosylaminoimidazolecarboxamide formyltransferase/IMP cyclohydrolase n=1 Tax=Priestia endophytica TaxID=135735 RepID=UPI002040C76C|nr:bifunctional phosphoribosylaminoimidazolecarboxamide formyltransferase/IMP cyclohydrolase [Priestia endophytica]MCM3540658.1 bifunctional phosphoribosylaminoimidazolecarboxamide formyltransferase/IMP cyclohydrolase [Priestia endophytica]
MAKKRALISVSDKNNVVELAQNLVELDFEIISTGGTKRTLEENGVDVMSVSDVTGFPEILDGRVKTLNPYVHGGLLARRNDENHIAQLKEHNITPIDLVVVNLYPFQETIAKENVTLQDAIENIDIGGPTMLRSAAKNYESISVLVDPTDYSKVVEELKENGNVSLETNEYLAAKVFRHTASYDALIAEYLTKRTGEEAPEKLTVTFEKVQGLRYGENPHQKAAFYKKPLASNASIATATQLHGKELSYNNINDANAAFEIVQEFTEPAVVAVKHMNPCGVGVGENIEVAYDRAYEADSTSIFGGIIAANRPVDVHTARKMKEIFLEIIIAPSFDEDALEVLKQKKNLRLLTVDFNANDAQGVKLTSVKGGLLLQDEDLLSLDDVEVKVATKREPTEDEWKNLKLAWKVVKNVKSNAIVLAKDEMTVGVGAGQMNRVGSANIAINQAGEKAKGSALGSDAFFPMGDTVEAAAKAGITAIIQPGGSVRDEESIQKADEYGIAMVFTGVRHFKH